MALLLRLLPLFLMEILTQFQRRLALMYQRVRLRTGLMSKRVIERLHLLKRLQRLQYRMINSSHSKQQQQHTQSTDNNNLNKCPQVCLQIQDFLQEEALRCLELQQQHRQRAPTSSPTISYSMTINRDQSTSYHLVLTQQPPEPAVVPVAQMDQNSQIEQQKQQQEQINKMASLWSNSAKNFYRPSQQRVNSSSRHQTPIWRNPLASTSYQHHNPLIRL